MKNDAWFKQKTSLIFQPEVAGLEAETFRVFYYLQTMFAVKRTNVLTEDDFTPVAPVRSWRVHLRKLAEVGLVEWDSDTHSIRMPAFTSLNSKWMEAATKTVTRTQIGTPAVTKMVKALPQADTSYEYDFDYVSPEWN